MVAENKMTVSYKITKIYWVWEAFAHQTMWNEKTQAIAEWKCLLVLKHFRNINEKCIQEKKPGTRAFEWLCNAKFLSRPRHLTELMVIHTFHLHFGFSYILFNQILVKWRNKDPLTREEESFCSRNFSLKQIKINNIAYILLVFFSF